MFIFHLTSLSLSLRACVFYVLLSLSLDRSWLNQTKLDIFFFCCLDYWLLLFNHLNVRMRFCFLAALSVNYSTMVLRRPAALALFCFLLNNEEKLVGSSSSVVHNSSLVEEEAEACCCLALLRYAFLGEMYKRNRTK